MSVSTKTTICYFSGTGNSRHAADRLAEAFPSASLKPMVALLASASPIVEADTIGIVFPIHAFTLPHLVELFLERVEFRNVSYVFALSTRHCSSRVAARIDRLLRRQGKTLSSFHSVQGPQSYLPVFPAGTYEEAMSMDRELDSVIPAIVRAARDGRRIMPKDGIVLSIVARTLFSAMTWIYRGTNCYHLGDRFYADDSCTGCGVCAAVCLSERIEMNNGVPVWDRARACLQCFACIHYCPERAIQIRSTRTQRKERYHYPGIGHRLIAEQRPDDYCAETTNEA
jgi:ferredoxin